MEGLTKMRLRFEWYSLRYFQGGVIGAWGDKKSTDSENG